MIQRLTKTQREIEVLAKRVPSLTTAQKEWAKRTFHYFQWVSADDKQISCPNCKEHIPIAGKINAKHTSTDVRCPHCGAIVNVANHYRSYSKRNYLQERFFEVMNVVGDWQVTRLIYMRSYCYVRKENTPWEFYECCQAWNRPDTPNTYFRALPKKIMPTFQFNPYSLFTWKYETNPDEETYHCYVDVPQVLEARRVNGANFFETANIAPKPQILPQYRRMGLNAEFLRKNIYLSALGWFRCFGGKDYKPMWETLIKAKEYDLIKRIRERHYKDMEDTYFNAWKIAKRHHYKIGDVSEWLDMIDLLDEFHYDCRNPHYICPTDAKALHNKLLELRRKEEIKERKERELKRLREAEESYGDGYTKRINKYLDMDIHNDDLHCIVLPTIKDFKDEGDHLGHCVFSCSYYLHTDSLILSARDAKDKRWETIEVSLKDFSIVQSYGYGDKHTEKHKEIQDLVMNNMWQIKQRYNMKNS